jgi:hypothetical protein
MSETHYKPTSDGDTAMLLAAARLESDNPLWIVLYGVYTEEFIAFPRFDAPSGMTILTAKYPLALAARMREIEREVHGYPAEIRTS